MNGPDTWLIRHAQKSALIAQERGARLKQQISDAKQRKAEAEAEYRFARSAPGRFDRFEPVISGIYQCPECWILREIRADLTPIDGEADADWFRCKTCHFEFSKKI
jgi:hypothetical protein